MNEGTPTAERRRTKVLAVSGAIAAAVLVLGVNGTLSSWTAAIINNNSNTADSGTSVVLTESGPDNTGATTSCTTAGDADNVATCSTINKYGDGGVAAAGATALTPGDSISTTVTLKNTGSADASTFTLTPAACTSVYNAGSQQGDPPAAADDLCSQLTVAVTCTGSTLTVAATSLADFQTAGPYALLTGLASGATATCTFTVALPSDAPANYAGQTVTQALQWEIDV